jgi:hypothetical protein
MCGTGHAALEEQGSHSEGQQNMIIWLASYPRSGNTLLRTVLKQTMGLRSYSDTDLTPQTYFAPDTYQAFGALQAKGCWNEFYKMASASHKRYLVKTHHLPQDDQPAIYVVRDGRSSLVSYVEFHRKFSPEHKGGLFELAIGEDYYGGWSEHYAKWVNGRSNVLLLRYEELVNASSACLNVIAQFVGHDAPRTEWMNPFDKLHQASPDFFRLGDTRWKRPPEWSELINGVFFMRHGALMHQLGYASLADIETACAALTPELSDFVRTA